MAEATTRRPVRWHIAAFLAPAVLVYTALMILPLFGTLQLSLFRSVDQTSSTSSALKISARCSATRAGPLSSGTRS